MCCGQKRSLLNNPTTYRQPAPARRPSSLSASRMSSQLQPATNLVSSAPNPSIVHPASAPPAAPQHAPVNLRYLKTSPVRVRGLITGNSYEFPGPNTVQPIDPRDVPGLVYTGLFRHT